MHITFGGITIYGKVGYLGCAWLVVCLFLKICMEYGFSMVYYSWSCGMLFVIDAFCGWW
jgi:hypothetical protein